MKKLQEFIEKYYNGVRLMVYERDGSVNRYLSPEMIENSDHDENDIINVTYEENFSCVTIYVQKHQDSESPMKLDLCTIFNVRENQHFWVKFAYEKDLCELVIKSNNIYDVIDEGEESYRDALDILEVVEVYYARPTVLTESTRRWLELLKSVGYKEITTNCGAIFSVHNELFDHFIDYKVDLEENYNIDLSFMEEQKTYDIKALLKDDSKEEQDK